MGKELLKSGGLISSVLLFMGTANSAVQTPYYGTPFAVTPTSSVVIQAEDFDKGGEGTAYHDLTATNTLKAYRPAEGVDIEAGGTGYKIGYTGAGEWMEYTISVQQAGFYTTQFSMATTFAGQTVGMKLNGVSVSGVISVPITSSWNSFITTKIAGFWLPQGTHILQFGFNTGGVCLDHFTISPSTGTVPVWSSLGGSIPKSPDVNADIIAVNGVPHIAIADPSVGNKISVLKYNGTSWVVVGTRGFSANPVSSLALGQANGVIYVSYSENNRGYSKKLNGSSWQAIGSAFSTEIHRVNGMEVINGTIHVSYILTGFDGSRSECVYGYMSVISQFKSGAWSKITNSCSGKYGSTYQITSSNNTLLRESHYAWPDDEGTTGTGIDKWTGSTWLAVPGSAFTFNPGYISQVWVSGSNALLNYTYAYTNNVTWKRFDGTAWSTIAAPLASPTSLTVAYNGMPVIAYLQNGAVSVAAFDGTVWNNGGAPNFATGSDCKAILNNTFPVALVTSSDLASCSIFKAQ